MNWPRSMRKQGRILHSCFWCITFPMDGIVSEGRFHRNFMHIGTTGKIYQLRTVFQLKVPDFSYLPISEGKPWSRYMKDTKEQRSVCWKPGSPCVMAQNKWWHLHEIVERCGICQSTSRACRANRKNQWGSTTCMAHLRHQIYSIGTGSTSLWLVTNFSKILIVRKLPNSSTHAWWPRNLGQFSWNLDDLSYLRVTMDLATVPGSSSSSYNSTRFITPHAALHHPQSNGFAEALVGISKKLMEKSVKDGKPWNYGLLQYRVTPISSTIPSPSRIPYMVGDQGLHFPDLLIDSKVCGNIKNLTGVDETVNPVLPLSTRWKSNQDSLYSSRKVHGNMSGRQEPLTSQPRSQIPSRMRFPDDSILRRTHARWLKPDLHLLILSWKVSSRRETMCISFPQMCAWQFPRNAPRHGATSLTNRQSSYTTHYMKRGQPPVRQDIPTSSQGVTQPSSLPPAAAAVRRSTWSN